jgi:predicted NUDIX family NTP pyrophosphohydrolase
VAKQSAGVLLYRIAEGALEVLLVHPGGPFWAKKDAGAWSIPKGEYLDGEDPLAAALREIEEETGIELGDASFLELGSVKQRGGKVLVAWAASGDFDPATLRSNTFSIEWPPRSGRSQDFPEVDRAEWFGLDAARAKLLAAQVPFLDRLAERVAPRRG